MKHRRLFQVAASGLLSMIIIMLLSGANCPPDKRGHGAIIITTTSPLPGGAVGNSYGIMLNVAGGSSPYVWSVIAGVLPDGLILQPEGQISGTPERNGTFNFTVRVRDNSGQTAEKPFTLTISERMWRVTAKVTEVRSPWPSVGQEYDIILKVNDQTTSSHQFVNDIWIPINLRIDLDIPESALAKIEVVVDPAAAVNGGIPQSSTLFNDNPPDLVGPYAGESSIEVWPGHPTNQYWTYFKWGVSATPF